jgi:hypothetical protein
MMLTNVLMLILLFYLFGKYVPAVKTMNESMNEKNGCNPVDKNESFSRNSESYSSLHRMEWNKFSLTMLHKQLSKITPPPPI